jgi:hypothetical protein
VHIKNEKHECPYQSNKFIKLSDPAVAQLLLDYSASDYHSLSRPQTNCIGYLSLNECELHWLLVLVLLKLMVIHSDRVVHLKNFLVIHLLKL